MTEIDSDGRLWLYWTETKDVFDVQLRYEGLAWLGVGFARRGRIKESAVVVVGEPGAEQVLKYEVVVATKGGRHEWSDVRRMRDESQTLRDATFFQTEKTTTLSFQKLSDEEDETPIRTTGGDDTTTLLVVVGEGGRSFPASTKTFGVSLNLFSDDDEFAREAPTTEGSDERAPSSNATTASPVAAPVKRPTERDVLTKGRMLSIIGGGWGCVFLVFVLYQCFCVRDYEEVEDFVPAYEDRPLLRASSDFYDTRYRRESFDE